MYAEYKQGMDDYKDGYSEQDCPYTDVDRRQKWLAGWCEACRNDGE